MSESSSSMMRKRAFLSCVQLYGPCRREPMSLLSPDHRSSYTSGPSVACLVMGRVLTCNKALLLFIRPSGCPPQRFCTCEPQWLMYVFFFSPHWRSFFSLSPLSASFWLTVEGPNQREGIYGSFTFTPAHMRPPWCLWHMHSFYSLPAAIRSSVRHLFTVTIFFPDQHWWMCYSVFQSHTDRLTWPSGIIRNHTAKMKL